MASTNPSQIRLGTRRSPLATAQAGWVADRLRAHGHQVVLVPITTLGDTTQAALTTIGGTGVFASALRRALLLDEIDIAVHSLKDLPVEAERGLVVAAVPVREDPRDVLVARDQMSLGELPAGSVVGTGSPRRAAQLAALGLGLVARDVRGNVDSRLAMVRAGRYDGVLLARAGLARLGRLGEVTEVLDPLQMLPAPGQGALAVECRSGRADLLGVLSVLDDPETRACVTAERALLSALEAGCTAPVGALAEVVEAAPGEEPELSLRAFVGTLDASIELRRSAVGPVVRPDELGRTLARVLLEDGADQIHAPAYPIGEGGADPPPRPRAGAVTVPPAQAASPTLSATTSSERAS